MRLSFTALGLEFDAKCHFSPGWPGTHWEPPEEEELTIEMLFHKGQDVSFLLEGTLLETFDEKVNESFKALLKKAEEDEAEYQLEDQ